MYFGQYTSISAERRNKKLKQKQFRSNIRPNFLAETEPKYYSVDHYFQSQDGVLFSASIVSIWYHQTISALYNIWWNLTFKPWPNPDSGDYHQNHVGTTVGNGNRLPTNLEVVFEFFPLSGDVWRCLETKIQVPR